MAAAMRTPTKAGVGGAVKSSSPISGTGSPSHPTPGLPDDGFLSTLAASADAAQSAFSKPEEERSKAEKHVLETVVTTVAHVGQGTGVRQNIEPAEGPQKYDRMNSNSHFRMVHRLLDPSTQRMIQDASVSCLC